METPEYAESKRPFTLTSGQSALIQALSEKDVRLGEMYRGALVVCANAEGPEALVQACHSLRELMEKIPFWYETVPAAEQLPRLNDKVQALEDNWKRALTQTGCRN